MNWTRIAAATAAVAILGAGLAMAQVSSAHMRSMLQGRLNLGVSSGRLVNQTTWHFGTGQMTNNSGTQRETLRFNGNGRTGSINFERTGPEEDFNLEMNSEGRFRFTRTPKPSTEAKPAVEFTQSPGEPIALAIGTGEKRKVCTGGSVWQLMIVHPDACRDHLCPVLEQLRPNSQWAQKSAALEAELLKLSSAGQPSDRQQWAAWVEQLADSQFTRREAADRQLRSAGPRILGFLNQLNFDQLDAEQQFRLRRIIAGLGRTTREDAPDQVAAMLAEDGEVWLALLGRADATVRQKAAQKLALILGEPIGIDPAADPATQTQARDQLRTKIQKKVQNTKPKVEPGKK